jgi:UDP-2,3-diacylglucosamine hydrolase
MKDLVFISDLHLMPERPEVMDLFIRFNEDIAAKADSLYILGDFLEVWWGDDDPAVGYQGVFNSLTKLATEHKTEIFLMHGNRDFMIGEALAERCHFSIIHDPHKITVRNRDALLMHGDTLCIDDVEYQKFRQMVRNPLWQQQVLTKTLEERFQLAQSIRENSKHSTTGKSEYIMDVNQAETEKVFLENDIDLIIHGHTHRPAIHHKTINGHDTTRIVLGDWHETGSYLHINDTSDELKLQTYQ